MARETKDVVTRVDLIARAWEARRPKKKFSGLSVEEFKDAAQASREAHFNPRGPDGGESWSQRISPKRQSPYRA